jgi:hypothetical protein
VSDAIEWELAAVRSRLPEGRVLIITYDEVLPDMKRELAELGLTEAALIVMRGEGALRREVETFMKTVREAEEAPKRPRVREEEGRG